MTGFLNISVLEPCETQLFLSTLFTRLKKDGSHRALFNLVNCIVIADHLKMDTSRDAIPLMYPECYFALIVFKNAYYSVSVDRRYRDYLAV